MNKILSLDIDIRDFTRQEIEPLAKYWTGSSEEFWRARGIDKSKLQSKESFTAAYEKTFAEKGDVRSISVILLQGAAIGVHTLTDIIESESAVFHAHIWDEKHRGRGIGVFSYLKAADFFMKKLNLKKIIYKTLKINKSANRIKEKIGIPCLGETILESPLFTGPLEAKLYEVDQILLAELKKRHGLY
jgi:RimJ/RimL family protein N-acetyltransferase